MSTVNGALRLALLGNPNCGKTALFNLLTGSRQKVANYPGVTVDRKEGQLTTPAGKQFRILDLPGAYSLNAVSVDEEITRDVVLGTLAGEQRPDMLVCVSDATNLKLNLRLVLEVQRLGLPMVLALNMTDLASKRGIEIDVPVLQRELGMPVVRTVAVQRGGASELIAQLEAALPDELPHPPAWLPPVGDWDSVEDWQALLTELVPAGTTFVFVPAYLLRKWQAFSDRLEVENMCSE